MNAAHITIAPQLPGPRERAPFVPSLRWTPGASRSARHAPTWAPWWRSSTLARLVRDALAEPFDAAGGVSWDLAEGAQVGPGGAARDSNRARYAWPPQPVAGRCESANLSQRPRVTRWIRNANGFLGRCESANLSRLPSRRTFARGVANGAIFESAQCSRPNVERNPERRELLGVLHFWRNGAEMRGVVALAWRSPSCARRTREAGSR